MRGRIKEVLSADRLYNLTAIAQTGAECIELIQRLRPDLALVDINISKPGAAHILRDLKANHWQTRICFLTEDQIPPDVLEAAKGGAPVFVNERFPDDLRDWLREIATELVSRPSPTPNRSATIRAAISPRTAAKRHLTFRQNQIATMLKIGSSNREIARVLGVRRYHQSSSASHLPKDWRLQPHSTGCPVICGRVDCCLKTSNL
jgi:DNA-binding NarL/FixJ family response regulator